MKAIATKLRNYIDLLGRPVDAQDDVGKEIQVRRDDGWVKATLTKRPENDNDVAYVHFGDDVETEVQTSETRVHDPLIKNIRNRLIEISNQMRKDWKLGTP